MATYQSWPSLHCVCLTPGVSPSLAADVFSPGLDVRMVGNIFGLELFARFAGTRVQAMLSSHFYQQLDEAMDVPI